eukprot:jgi/Psemu1/285561/fgenesh1_pg.93_\
MADEPVTATTRCSSRSMKDKGGVVSAFFNYLPVGIILTLMTIFVSIFLLLLVGKNPFPTDASPIAPGDRNNDSYNPKDVLNYNLLQKCIDNCQAKGYCCGNRLNGESITSSFNYLSCANGCEIAFYSNSVAECKQQCTKGNAEACTYSHKDIFVPFEKCFNCQEGCDTGVSEEECSVGCEEAATIDNKFYRYHHCTDDPDWGLGGDAEKSCAWVASNPSKAKKKCRKKETIGRYAGKRVHKICPVACRCAFSTCAYCGPDCTDDPDFRYGDDPDKSCKDWVAVNKKWRRKARCNREGVRDACPATCGGFRTAIACGTEENGELIEMCVRKKWQSIGCLKRSSLGVGRVGYNPAFLASEQDEIYGWSYYRRAYDLIQDTPAEELGWGQWSSGHKDDLEVCGRHPHGFVCDKEPPATERMLGELQNCGSQDLDVLKKCEFSCCGEPHKCFLSGNSNIEGGMGYWMYTLETPHVKWMGPSAVNHWYRSISTTFLATGPNMCTKLGGAVRVSNNIVLPNDQIQFEVPENGKIDGFLGYMLTRTPIGKRSAEDKANHWTIILDAENFSGPIYYISSWFWDSIASWHPQSSSWADPSILISYAQEGFEGSIGSFEFTDENGSTWIRTNKVAFPRDNINDAFTDTATLATGHSIYADDWATNALEGMLSGSGPGFRQTVDHFLQISQSSRKKPECITQFESHGDGALELSMRDDSMLFLGFGIGDDLPDDENQEFDESNEAHCHTRLVLDTSKMSCDEDSAFCQIRRYIRIDKSDILKGVLVEDEEVPAHVKHALDVIDFEPTKMNDGRYLGPPGETEKACFDTPGPAPADPRLYCTRLASGTWLGFRWYRFVDQPELNQVFASIQDPDARNAAKCFMQERIERLHEAVATGGPTPRWFRPPQGDEELPAEKVRIDPAYLVTPPKSLEKGFVPVAVWERNREVSEDCEVFLGEYDSEPEPYPEGYYDGFVRHEGEYYNQECPANLESNGPFTFPGTVYPYPHKNYDQPRQGK